MGLERTYKIEHGPAAVQMQEYAAEVEGAFRELLESDPSEPELQEFLERNPALVPGARTPGVPSGRSPLHEALITQPRLPGLKTKIPDFMWISSHSETWYPTLIEIERPGKRIFRSRGRLTADFTEARNQLAQWRVWFGEPENVQKLVAEYGIPDELTRRLSTALHMILIYGRRSEFVDDPVLSKLRGSLLPGRDEELVSYDRLRVDVDLRDCITVRCTGSGTYKAVAVPPVFTLGPSSAARLLQIEDMEPVIRKSAIGESRKGFLIERLPYWRKWAASARHGFHAPSDRE